MRILALALSLVIAITSPAAVRSEGVALLLIPSVLEIGMKLPAAVLVRWEGPESLTVRISIRDGRKYIDGRLKVFSETGAPVPTVHHMTLPLALPTEEVTLEAGTVFKADLLNWHDGVPILKAGKTYYAIAEFQMRSSSGRVITFVTKKSWFKVEDANDKKA